MGGDAHPQEVEFLRDARRIAMAHRGFTSFRFPMNSMGAFHEAAKIGFRYIETDVRATRDGVAVIQHDRKLAPESGVAGAVDQLTWPEVSTADLGGGEPIPTLEELLVALPQMRFNIDIKADSAVEPTVEVIERLQAHRRVLIASFSERRRQRALRLMSQRVASAAGMGAFLGFMAARTAGRRASAMRMLRDSDCLQLPARFGGLPVITPALVRSVHASRRQVHAWTIDDPAMIHALFDIGVDGIITDRADVLCDVLGARGEW
ncbi:glycerophosphoryl diester phosphodiesterase GlpQ2 [Mycobacterium liflandii 128FXT]|uniref:Glycerophosphoryl diester phosphodiesterase GlpQ2 n=1 Tax=Mycobacterium liflandii (strain 128FXT) TaxID=459424 RepID=L7UYS0_MYCL1|nr:glycerophosphodiester phosphodiesterase family protein [Mycobacterium ulcerans]AGC60591.1 glycerophosphoryl diester phosphodiesterase GlpQ2 [Mycobacterium liflandii 128FXT]ULL09172.1 glycerophosphodiester phosphodiesterase [Mycobacterium liflandii]